MQGVVVPQLRSVRTGRVLHLAQYNVIGRDTTSRLRIDDSRVSRSHAALEWREQTWWLRDLGSANGTWVAGQRLTRDARPLIVGDRLAFGAEDGAGWELVSSGAPVAFAVEARSGQEVGAVGEVLVLPDEEDPSPWVIYRATDGRWTAEREGENRDVADAELLVQDDEMWRLWLPDRSASTERASPHAVDTSRFRFELSRDWEHARLIVMSGEERLDLGDRQCWVVLVVLARERLADAAAPEHDQGWVDIDQLAREAGMRRGTIDVYVTRARAELARHGVRDAARITLARRGQRRIAVTPDRLEVTTLDDR